MQFIDPEERGALLSDFKPHTLYAFYLTTLMVNSPGAKGGISKIYYQRTKFSRKLFIPSAVYHSAEEFD